MVCWQLFYGFSEVDVLIASRYIFFMSKVIVASTNPVKRNAAQQGFLKVFPDKKFVFSGVKIPSGVSDQPMTDKETYQGALNRAKNAKAKLKPASVNPKVDNPVTKAAS